MAPEYTPRDCANVDVDGDVVFVSEVRRAKTIKPHMRDNNTFGIQESSKLGHDSLIVWVEK
jgi:hypothetical protein